MALNYPKLDMPQVVKVNDLEMLSSVAISTVSQYKLRDLLLLYMSHLQYIAPRILLLPWQHVLMISLNIKERTDRQGSILCPRYCSNCLVVHC